MLARGRNAVKTQAPNGAGRMGRWLPASAWMGGIFYLSHRSEPMARTASDTPSVFVHLVLYAVLAALLFWPLASLARGEAEALWLAAGLAFGLAVLYGALDEVHQAFVPGRVASEVDLAFDASGAAAGAVVSMLAARLGLGKYLGRPGGRP